jgi:hypothetical protein
MHGWKVLFETKTLPSMALSAQRTAVGMIQRLERFRKDLLGPTLVILVGLKEPLVLSRESEVPEAFDDKLLPFISRYLLFIYSLHVG